MRFLFTNVMESYKMLRQDLIRLGLQVCKVLDSTETHDYPHAYYHSQEVSFCNLTSGHSDLNSPRAASLIFSGRSSRQTSM
jgi:hypothetical protein